MGFLLLAAMASPASGAVTNPSFETYSSLPGCGTPPTSYGAGLAQTWTATSDGTPDYYHLNAGNIGCVKYTPNPHTGCAHIGIAIGAAGNGAYREFVESPIGTLNANEPVIIRYYVRRILGTKIKRLGVRLTTGPVAFAYGLVADGEVAIGTTPGGYVPVDVTVLPLATGSYTLVIGSFDTAPDTIPSYFFIDDVSVTPCPGVIITPPQASVHCLSEEAVFSTFVSGGGTITYQWQKLVGGIWKNLVDNSNVSGATTSTLHVANIVLSDYTLYRCLVTCSCGTLTTPPAGLFSSGPPVALYRFTSPDRAADVSGHDYNGALGDVLTGTTNGCGGYLRFRPDNNADEFTVPHAPALDMVGAMTGMAWIRPLGPHSTPMDIGCPEGTIFSKGGNYWFQVGQGNSQLEFQNEGSGASIAVAPVNLAVNTWVHVAFVRQTDKRTIRFFVNGAWIATQTLTADPGGNTDPLMVGNHGNGNSPDRCEFNGDIDEIVLIDRALTDTEVQRAYQCTCNPAAPDWYPVPRRFPVSAQPQTELVVPRNASPSPMRQHTTFEFVLDQPRAMRLEIFDVAGRHVRSVVAGTGRVGTNLVAWDGCDDGHRPVGSGIYLVRVSAGEVSQWSRVVVIR